MELPSDLLPVLNDLSADTYLSVDALLRMAVEMLADSELPEFVHGLSHE